MYGYARVCVCKCHNKGGNWGKQNKISYPIEEERETAHAQSVRFRDGDRERSPVRVGKSDGLKEIAFF